MNNEHRKHKISIYYLEKESTKSKVLTSSSTPNQIPERARSGSSEPLKRTTPGRGSSPERSWTRTLEPQSISQQRTSRELLQSRAYLSSQLVMGNSSSASFSSSSCTSRSSRLSTTLVWSRMRMLFLPLHGGSVRPRLLRSWHAWPRLPRGIRRVFCGGFSTVHSFTTM